MSDFEKWGRFGVPLFCFTTDFMPYETSPDRGIGFTVEFNGKLSNQTKWSGKARSREEFHFFQSPIDNKLGTSLYGKTKG